MFKSIILLVFVFLFGCTSGDIKSENDNGFSQYLPECAAGCSSLSLLQEEADGELGCTQSRSVGGEECKIVCAKKMAAGNKYINPKCWTTLKSCNDFEEKCNFGELY